MVWPPFIRRRPILAPMRPSPIIPNCMTSPADLRGVPAISGNFAALNTVETGVRGRKDRHPLFRGPGAGKYPKNPVLLGVKALIFAPLTCHYPQRASKACHGRRFPQKCPRLSPRPAAGKIVGGSHQAHGESARPGA